MIVSESEFSKRVLEVLTERDGSLLDFGMYNSVTGPGRSGAIAAVYVSHLARLPFVPFAKQLFVSNPSLAPVLVVDTAEKTGRTIRRSVKVLRDSGIHADSIVFYREPPRVHFWYEQISLHP